MFRPIPGIRLDSNYGHHWVSEAYADKLSAILGIVLTRYSDAPSARSATLERCAKAERFGLLVETIRMPYDSRACERLRYLQHRLSGLLWEEYKILARQMHPRITLELIRSLASDARLRDADLLHCRIVWSLTCLYRVREDRARLELEQIRDRIHRRICAIRGRSVSQRWF